jgi:hypothetical protein
MSLVWEFSPNTLAKGKDSPPPWITLPSSSGVHTDLLLPELISFRFSGRMRTLTWMQLLAVFFVPAARAGAVLARGSFGAAARPGAVLASGSLLALAAAVAPPRAARDVAPLTGIGCEPARGLVRPGFLPE